MLLLRLKSGDSLRYVTLPLGPHKALRVTPAIAANVTNRVWSLEELVERTSSDG